MVFSKLRIGITEIFIKNMCSLACIAPFFNRYSTRYNYKSKIVSFQCSFGFH